jgi:hypothetical protein
VGVRGLRRVGSFLQPSGWRWSDINLFDRRLPAIWRGGPRPITPCRGPYRLGDAERKCEHPMLPTLAALSLGDDDCATEVPTEVAKGTPKLSEILKGLEQRRKAKRAVDRVISRVKKEEEAAAAKAARQRQREKEKEAKAAAELEEIFQANEREIEGKAARATNDAAKTSTIRPIEAWVEISTQYSRVLDRLLGMVAAGEPKYPDLLVNNTVAALKRERAAAARDAAAARIEVEEIRNESLRYVAARSADPRSVQMSEEEKRAKRERNSQLKREIIRADAIVAERNAQLSVDELVRSLVHAGNRADIRLSAASVDGVWDVALSALVPEAGARATHLYDRSTIDMIASYNPPPSQSRVFRILADARWTRFFRNVKDTLFESVAMRILKGANAGEPDRIFLGGKDDPTGGLTILKGLAFEIAVSKADIALAESRVEFYSAASAASSEPGEAGSDDASGEAAPEVPGL